MSLKPWRKFVGAYGSLRVQKLSGNFSKDFKSTLDNITIYVQDTYDHEMGIMLKA